MVHPHNTLTLLSIETNGIKNIKLKSKGFHTVTIVRSFGEGRVQVSKSLITLLAEVHMFFERH